MQKSTSTESCIPKGKNTDWEKDLADAVKRGDEAEAERIIDEQTCEHTAEYWGFDIPW